MALFPRGVLCFSRKTREIAVRHIPNDDYEYPERTWMGIAGKILLSKVTLGVLIGLALLAAYEFL